METEQLGRSLTKRTRVDVLEQRVVVGDEQTVISVLGVQINIEAQTLHTPIENTHGLVDQCGESDRDVSHRVEYLVGQINRAIASHEDGVNKFRLETKLVVGIVEHRVELAGHRVGERVEHIHIEHLRHHLVWYILPRAIIVLQHLACTFVEVAVQCLITWHEHNAHVLLQCHRFRGAVGGGAIELAPSRVELQQTIGRAFVGSEVESHASLAALREVTLLIHRIHVGIVKTVVFNRGFIILAVTIGSAEAVEQLGISLSGRMVGDEVCHVWQWGEHFFHLVYESIGTFDVLLFHHDAVHVGIA